MSSEKKSFFPVIRKTSAKDIYNWLFLSLYKSLYGLLSGTIFYVFCLSSLDMLRRETSLLVLLFFLMLMSLIKIYGALNIGNERISELIISQTAAIFLAYSGMFVIFNLIRYLRADFIIWILSFSATLCFSIVWTIFGNRFYFLLYPALKTIIVHGSGKTFDIYDLIRLYPKKFSIISRIDLTAMVNGLEPLLEYDAVILNEVDSGKRNRVIKYCISKGIKVFIRPKIGDLILSNSKRTKILNIPMITIRQNEQYLGYQIMKRFWDILLALVGLVVASPLFLVIAILIKLVDGGPVFYHQTRLTKGGREFSITKFRSMRVNSEKDGVARLARQHDDRITLIGRFLRPVRLDELPQLFNILRGDMSFVGPRPERPEIAVQYAVNFPEFHLRLHAKAGLTGYAQVYGKYNATPYEKLQMDLIYLVNQSFFTDLKILLATLKVLFTKEATEGVKDGQLIAEKNERDISNTQ